MKTARQFRSGEDLIQLAIRLGLLAFLIYWTFVLIRPFVPILAWSIVLAVALYPVFNLLSRLLGGRPKLAAAILTVVNLGIVIGPATWLGLSAVEGVKDFAANLSAGNLVVPSPPDGVKNWPLIGPQLFELWNQASNNIRAALREVAPHLKPLAGTMLGLAGNAGVGTLKFLLSVALAGFLFPYGSQLVAAGRGFLYRIVPEQSEHFLELAGDDHTRGIPGRYRRRNHPVPAGRHRLQAGRHSRRRPVGLRGHDPGNRADRRGNRPVSRDHLDLDRQGFYHSASADACSWCIVGILDNILKPLVMGRGLTTPTLVILVGVIGGTLAHGIVGLFIGPIILSVAWELTVAWIRTDRADATLPNRLSNVDLNQRSMPRGSLSELHDK